VAAALDSADSRVFMRPRWHKCMTRSPPAAYTKVVVLLSKIRFIESFLNYSRKVAKDSIV